MFRFKNLASVRGTVCAVALLAGAATSITPAFTNPAIAQTAKPNLLGFWRATGDFEGSEAALPSGGTGVGWAPLSRGTPETRLAARPSKAERDAAATATMKRLATLAAADLDTRLGSTAAPPSATAEGLKNFTEINKTINFKYLQEHCMGANVINGVVSSDMVVSEFPQGYVFTYESGYPRVIFTDGRDDSEAFPGMFGYSIGKWEGGTLVVKTNNITSTGNWMSAGMRGGWPLSNDVTLTEWFTPKADGTMTVKREFVDPVNYTEPFASLTIIERTTDKPIISPCVENLADQPFSAQADQLDEHINDKLHAARAN